MSTNNIDNKQYKIEENMETIEYKGNSLENKNKFKKNKEKESILSESSNENESNKNTEKNFEQIGNDNDNKNKNITNNVDYNSNDISKMANKINTLNNITYNNENNNNLNNNFDNKLLNINNNFNNNTNEDNISRSMSSHHSSHSSNNRSFASKSRSRSRSNNNSNRNENLQNYDNFNERNVKNFGNKFKDYNNNRRDRNKNINNNNFIMKNGCCRDCMKAFSKNGKSCLCQVPRKERKFHLPENGCNYCGCKGCNPIDVKYNERMAQKSILFKDKGINHKNQRILDSDDENLKIKEDDVDYYNMEKKEIQEDLNDVLKINSIFYGFGVPLRTPSYILGYNPNINYFYEKRNNIKKLL